MTAFVRFEDWTRHGKWGNPPGIGSTPKLATVVHHSVTNTTGLEPLQQAQAVESVIYGRRVKSKFSMLAYSDLVTPDGTVWEGRAGHHQNGANNNTNGARHTVELPSGPLTVRLDNSNTYSICLVGNYHPGVPGVPTLSPTDA